MRKRLNVAALDARVSRVQAAALLGMSVDQLKNALREPENRVAKLAQHSGNRVWFFRADIEALMQPTAPLPTDSRSVIEALLAGDLELVIPETVIRLRKAQPTTEATKNGRLALVRR